MAAIDIHIGILGRFCGLDAGYGRLTHADGRDGCEALYRAVCVENNRTLDKLALVHKLAIVEVDGPVQVILCQVPEPNVVVTVV